RPTRQRAGDTDDAANGEPRRPGADFNNLAHDAVEGANHAAPGVVLGDVKPRLGSLDPDPVVADVGVVASVLVVGVIDPGDVAAPVEEEGRRPGGDQVGADVEVKVPEDTAAVHVELDAVVAVALHLEVDPAAKRRSGRCDDGSVKGFRFQGHKDLLRI